MANKRRTAVGGYILFAKRMISIHLFGSHPGGSIRETSVQLRNRHRHPVVTAKYTSAFRPALFIALAGGQN
jgi:hypothetical protein